MKISSLRHFHSALVLIRPPETLRKGSGNLALAVKDGVPGAGHVPPLSGGGVDVGPGGLLTETVGVVGGGVGVGVGVTEA